MIRRFLFGFLIVLILVGCVAPTTPTPTVVPATLVQTPAPTLPTPQTVADLPATPTAGADGLAVTITQIASTASATPDTRLPPERWMDWSIVPKSTGRAMQIFQKGLELGVNSHALTKIGDCQSIEEALMGNYDRPGRYTLPADQPYLQETVDWFAGSFIRDGYAVKGGFNAASLLSPMWADPDACLAGETPLVCEFRVHKPAFVIISLEVWWEGRTTERYIQYMRTIIEYAIARGAVPILSTKADNIEGDNSINLANARLAYEYDLPLWNFWAIAQTLPNGGLDPVRNDGFHLSEESWAARSLTALQALDSVWRGVRGVTLPTSVYTQTPVIMAVTPTPKVTAAKVSLAGKVVFGAARRREERLEALGVYALDPQTGESTQVLGEGFTLQSLSADGKLLLANRGASLYLIPLDGSPGSTGLPGWLLADNFFTGGQLGALIAPDGSAVYMITGDGSLNTLWHTDPNGEVREAISQPGDTPVEIYALVGGSQLVFANGLCPGNGDCSPAETAVVALSGTPFNLTGVYRPAFAPDASRLAYTTYDKNQRSSLSVASLDRKLDRPVNLGGTAADFRLMDYAWSPDSQKLSLLLLARSDYSGKWLETRHVLLTPANWGTQELPFVSGLNPRTLWSPDGSHILLTSTLQDTNGAYALSFNLYDLAARKTTPLNGTIGLPGADVIITTNLYWLAP
jgi:hypothetical protein